MQNRYRDKYFRLIGSLLIGHFFVVVGQDKSLFLLWQDSDYYRDTIITALITLAVWGLVRIITIYLDKKISWTENIFARVAWQVLLGLGLPILLSLGLVFLFFIFIIGQNILESSFPIYEFPISVLIILMLNLYYVTYFFYNELRYKNLIINDLQEKTVSEFLPENHITPKSDTKTLIVNSGQKNIPIATEQIAYFFKEDDYLYLCTFQQEKFLLNATLDELAQKLNEEVFFRVNRQIIVNRKACKYYTQIEFGKINLILVPTYEKEVIISQKRANEFKEWLSK
ncbi:MAG: LytTR family transcriptional regulator [Microscillaceae bacterium]|jgi:hypothetical protein|nr:LytTR family transcriptional regulator [Microscillaceae bacterium]